MLEKIRRQHYVWQHYFSPWTINGEFFCMRKDGKILHTKPSDLAVGIDFYRQTQLTPDELKYLRDTFQDSLTMDWIKITNYIFELKKILPNISGANDHNNNLNILIHNNGEFIQTHFENMGKKYLDMLWDERIDFWVDEKSKIEFTFYLMMQFLRTKRQKDTILAQKEIFENENVRPDEIWEAMRIMLTTDLVGGVVLGEEDWELIPLKNNTTIPFITSDQPVISLYWKYGNETEKLVFYYPIKPYFSILLKKKNESYRSIVDESDVLFYNDKILYYSDIFIFSNSSEIKKFISENESNDT
jgi:hypothetical protein